MSQASQSTLIDVAKMAAWVRSRVVEMSHRAETPHLASALSVTDILCSAYSGILNIDSAAPLNFDRDRLILSKGHAVTALYAALAYRGFFDLKRLDSFNQNGYNLPEQPSPGCAPGVEWATGSLGHGLGVGLGMALAGRIHKINYKTLVVMSDGECNEGSVWEAAMLAGAQKISTLGCVVDFNKWQATGRSQEVMALDPLVDKFSAFGWKSIEIDGHDSGQIAASLNRFKTEKEQPTAIIAHTIKGKGVSFMEDDNNWHYRIPTSVEVAKALSEINS